jgi:antitoxin FitA
MATTLTLKSIPAKLYARLKSSAKANRRSMNSEALVCLESALLFSKGTVEEQLERARRLRQEIAGLKVTNKDIDRAKADGRP